MMHFLSVASAPSAIANFYLAQSKCDLLKDYPSQPKTAIFRNSNHQKREKIERK